LACSFGLHDFFVWASAQLVFLPVIDLSIGRTDAQPRIRRRRSIEKWIVPIAPIGSADAWSDAAAPLPSTGPIAVIEKSALWMGGRASYDPLVTDRQPGGNMQVKDRPRDGDSAAAQLLREREDARCKALVARDYAALGSLLDGALVHTHSTGEVQDLGAYLAGVKGPACFLAIERGPLTVQVFGEVALMLGLQSNTIQPPAPVAAVTVHTHVQQVWLRRGGDWRLLAFQATRLPALPRATG
jgi:hypothetical protein